CLLQSNLSAKPQNNPARHLPYPQPGACYTHALSKCIATDIKSLPFATCPTWLNQPQKGVYPLGTGLFSTVFAK
ncbi:hypothetical protein, partial [Aeromonas salmonicida]|uniref:hypothetical protein n=1 Tax=Aeromonas salmonicida TaxID=645 RepID=UPI001EE72E14